jgi:hypothetical protein
VGENLPEVSGLLWATVFSPWVGWGVTTIPANRDVAYSRKKRCVCCAVMHVNYYNPLMNMSKHRSNWVRAGRVKRKNIKMRLLEKNQ